MRKIILGISAMAATLAMGGVALADSNSINFDSYTLGNIHGQDGWSKTGAYDVEVETNGYGFSSFGTQVLRISNAITSGSFGDQTFSKPLTNEAGEADALSNGMSGGARQNHFEAQFDFTSAQLAQQPGLFMSVSPDRGDGARMSYLGFSDNAAGIDVNFFEVTGTSDPANFVSTVIATNLSRASTHTAKFVIDFVDGPSNDVVKIYIDGVLKHTGTTWENYYRFDDESFAGNNSRTVDSLLFRVGGTAVPGNSGNGYLVDNLSLSSSVFPPVCLFTTSGSTMTLNGDCTTSTTILVPQGATLNGAGYTITAVDPAGGHFKGAIIKNEGTVATVTNLKLTASGLADVCDAGNDRLRGILFDGASGSITNNTVSGVRQGLSGCQEGNAIEVRNEPFATGGSDKAVTISGNTVSNYQKNAITANGSVAATITNNSVVGDGPITFIAQNGIQIGFGGTATLTNNTVSGNSYSPADTEACGILYFQADGVKASKNNIFNNEVNQCNVGKGGGKFKPAL